jgi:hypothetical protein
MDNVGRTVAYGFLFMTAVASLALGFGIITEHPMAMVGIETPVERLLAFAVGLFGVWYSLRTMWTLAWFDGRDDAWETLSLVKDEEIEELKSKLAAKGFQLFMFEIMSEIQGTKESAALRYLDAKRSTREGEDAVELGAELAERPVPGTTVLVYSTDNKWYPASLRDESHLDYEDFGVEFLARDNGAEITQKEDWADDAEYQRFVEKSEVAAARRLAQLNIHPTDEDKEV